MSQVVADLLAPELQRVAIAPDSLLIKLVGSRIADRGESELSNLPPEFQVVSGLRGYCSHHLGMGASLTEFLIAGLPLNREFQQRVASLGGIAHTIYALFDFLLDHSGCVPKLFVGHAHLFLNDTTPDDGFGSQRELVLSLVKLYFEQLNLLCSSAPKLRTLTERTIHKLYLAELESAVPGEISEQVWWRKNALPLIVMALPAWTSPREPSNITFIEHLRWLARLGAFVGWLDDFSDFEKDSAGGQANRLKRLNRGAFPLLARQTAASGQRLLQAWDSHNNQPAFRNTFTVIVWMWLTSP